MCVEGGEMKAEKRRGFIQDRLLGGGGEIPGSHPTV